MSVSEETKGEPTKEQFFKKRKGEINEGGGVKGNKNNLNWYYPDNIQFYHR